jgi:hypothetical protein
MSEKPVSPGVRQCKHAAREHYLPVETYPFHSDDNQGQLLHPRRASAWRDGPTVHRLPGRGHGSTDVGRSSISLLCAFSIGLVYEEVIEEGQ